MNHAVNRRDVLKTSLALGAGYWLGTSAAPARAAANDKLNIAFVGLGGQGGANLGPIGKSGNNIVALCDVDDQRAGKAYETYPGAKKFFDFRQMFDELEKSIDAVVISTPDHTHFHPAYWALTRGKHVYLEKPMAHNVWEVRKLTELAREKKLATQLGAQRHTMPMLRKSVEIVQSGRLGPIKEVYSWIASSRGMVKLPEEKPPAPDTLKWDLWVGPAAERPYTPGLAPYNWRFYWDYGTGEAGNWGCHVLDIPFWALGIKHPTRVDVTKPQPDPLMTPKQMASRFEFPVEGRAPIVLHWHQGVPPIIAEKKLDPKSMNNLFIGEKAMLLCSWDNAKIIPNEGEATIGPPEPFLYKSPGFHNEWLSACKGGEPASCNFDYSGPMTETVLLANAAYRAGGGFQWDAKNLKATGYANHAPFIKEEYRKGWEIT